MNHVTLALAQCPMKFPAGRDPATPDRRVSSTNGSGGMTSLQRAMTRFDATMTHHRWVDADPQKVWRALVTVTLDDLRIT